MDDPNHARNGWLAFALGSAVFAAATALLGKVAVGEINSNLATLIRTVVILVLVTGVVAARGEWQPLGDVSRRAVLMLLLSGAATGLSWLCYYRALQLAPASQVAPIDKLSVAITIVVGVLVLGEPVTWRMAVGGGLIVAGALVLAWG